VVTVTLPEGTLSLLAGIDPDRSWAIVKATALAVANTRACGAVELVEAMPGFNIILVGPSRYLRQIKWLRMLEVAPGRFLLALPSGTAIDSLEVALGDLLDKMEAEEEERPQIEELRDLVRSVRHEAQFSKAELLFVSKQKGESKTR
jgi:hypothetical protein